MEKKIKNEIMEELRDILTPPNIIISIDIKTLYKQLRVLFPTTNDRHLMRVVESIVLVSKHEKT